MKTIQKMIWEELNEIHKNKGNYDPSLCAEKLVNLSILYANLTEKIADFEYIYNGIIQLASDKDKERPYAKIEAEAKGSQEYYTLRKAQALEKALIECIRSLKKYLKVKTGEVESSKY